MNSLLSSNDSIHLDDVLPEVKTEKFMSSENNIKIKDAEYMHVLNNYEEKTIANWNTLTWKCSYCHHIDSSYEILLVHLQSMHQISNVENTHYQCNVCEESVLNYASFLNHVRCAHYESLKLCCDVCNERFSNYKELALHREEHIEILTNVYPVVYHCSLCEKVHSTEKDLKIHIQLYHSSIYLEEKEYVITLGTSQNSKEDGNSTGVLDVKDEYHETEEVFQCGLCVKTFCNESDLEIHMNTHDEKRLLKCGTCFKTFTSQYQFTLHMRIHTGERPYKCEICLKSFIRKPDLRRHGRAHNEKRPFNCEICEKSFKSKDDKKLHMRIHTGERPYKCEICSKRFIQNAHMRNHLLSHSEDRPFKCELCQKSFKSNASKNRHKNCEKAILEKAINTDTARIFYIMAYKPIK